MDTERLVGFLIDGSLIDILEAARYSPDIACIEKDESVLSGLRLYFQSLRNTQVRGATGHRTPEGATDGFTVGKEKKQEVAKYLMHAFGMSEEQASCVVFQAHEYN